MNFQSPNTAVNCTPALRACVGRANAPVTLALHSITNGERMLEKFKKVSNPLTIIAIFAGITEAMCTIALAATSDQNEIWIVIFLVSFPTALVIMFFSDSKFQSQGTLRA